MLKQIILLTFFLVCLSINAKDYSVTSPSGILSLNIHISKQSTWSLAVDGKVVSSDNVISLSLADGRVLGENASVRKVERFSRHEHIVAPFYRQASFDAAYNALTLTMKDGYGIELRAYNDGVAYRFTTHMKDSLRVVDESVCFNLPEGASYVMANVANRKYPYECSFEGTYSFMDKVEPSPENTSSFLPVLVNMKESGRLLLMESDLLDYPGMFVRTDNQGLKAFFPPRTKSFTWSRRYNKHRLEFTDDIALIAGKSKLPWRIVGYAPSDTGLPTNNMVYALATPNRIGDYSWVKPGLSTWDWWNAFSLTGVDFECGINTKTYKYHIDFAAANSIPYIVMDEGWYKCPDMLHSIPAIDLPEICRYGAEKGVKVILWGTAHLVQHLGIEKVFRHYSEMGVAGFKLDFIDGQDQESVKMLTDIAEVAARHHLVLDYHGVYKPAGLTRTYPNVLNFEGVFGLEQIGKQNLDMPLNDVTIPYIRMATGPMDYTPGGVQCKSPVERHTLSRGHFVQGTRAHQVAMYVVFDSPFSMLCDSPSKYIKEQPMTSFISSIPTTFDSTFIQSGEVGRNIVSVRHGGDKWYVGGLTSWTPTDATVDFSFLPQGQWQVTIFRDGVNSHKIGNDYVVEKTTVDAQQKIGVHMAPGGGFAMIVEPLGK